MTGASDTRPKFLLLVEIFAAPEKGESNDRMGEVVMAEFSKLWWHQGRILHG